MRKALLFLNKKYNILMPVQSFVYRIMKMIDTVEKDPELKEKQVKLLNRLIPVIEDCLNSSSLLKNPAAD